VGPPVGWWGAGHGGHLGFEVGGGGDTPQDGNTNRHGRGNGNGGRARPDLPRLLRRLATVGALVARQSSARQRASRDGFDRWRAGVVIVLELWPS